jgi:hypothetical protein
MKGKTKYSGGVKIRDKKIEGWVGNGRVRVSSLFPTAVSLKVLSGQIKSAWE